MMSLKQLINKLPSILIGGSSLLFAIVFFAFGRDLLFATEILLYAMSISAIILVVLRCDMTLIQWAAVLGTIFFAGLTCFFKNEAFIQWRSTITNSVIGSVLVILYFLKKTPLEYLLGKPLELRLPQTIWLRVNIICAIYMFLCAIINAIFALSFSKATWMAVKTFGMSTLAFFFMLGLFAYLYKEHRKNVVKQNKQ